MLRWLKQLFGLSFTTVGAEEAHKKLASHPAPMVLDVRQPEEFRSGHIAGATHIPLDELRERMIGLPREREVLCVFHTGSRSSFAARQLSAAGFRVLNLQGGLIAWERANLPLKRGSAR